MRASPSHQEDQTRHHRAGTWPRVGTFQACPSPHLTPAAATFHFPAMVPSGWHCRDSYPSVHSQGHPPSHCGVLGPWASLFPWLQASQEQSHGCHSLAVQTLIQGLNECNQSFDNRNCAPALGQVSAEGKSTRACGLSSYVVSKAPSQGLKMEQGSLLIQPPHLCCSTAWLSQGWGHSLLLPPPLSFSQASRTDKLRPSPPSGTFSLELKPSPDASPGIVAGR